MKLSALGHFYINKPRPTENRIVSLM